MLLIYGIATFWLSVQSLVVGIRKIDQFQDATLLRGLVWGSVLTITWLGIGTISALCFARFSAGFVTHFRAQELLVKNYDRLRELGELPDSQGRRQDDPVKPSE